jgi:hypothetical protein
MVARPEDCRLVCQLLNEGGAIYLVAGGQACILHGHVRATKDVDIFVPKDLENFQRVLDALGELPLRLAWEIPADIAFRKPFTIVGDDPRVDILTAARGLRFDDAAARRCVAEVDGVMIPYVSLEDLIWMKDTGRLKDQADLEQLRRLKELRDRTAQR